MGWVLVLGLCFDGFVGCFVLVVWGCLGFGVDLILDWLMWLFVLGFICWFDLGVC